MTAIPAQRSIRLSVLYFGTPVALLATVNPDGRSNLSPISSVWSLADRLVLGLGLEGQAWLNLQRHADCVLNLPSARQWPQVERLARATGRAELLQAERAPECPLQVEARLASPLSADPVQAAQARGFAIVELQILRVHAHEDITVPGSQHVDTQAWQPLIYLFRHYCGTSLPMAANFRAEQPLRTTFAQEAST
ncbi:pyridoxamine 5'-phosphate oxidase family protein [Paucibacter sp. DJ1R-11]|uniref:flavin reductase family protein n=1 Tax=Paucibacter sp. DJ1R-11 TaxID=2893556 RepID=UPI0021E42903|nr:pyridoxamine 5'-phosphate oxidase family protein [Paucibacter sp. DJ1R-11]MCV2366398.1 pyridoxamine 5'-phosphate oxidase family protein [Paucibacter sp. DJ1R-11]